jgi:hypothetical protein
MLTLSSGILLCVKDEQQSVLELRAMKKSTVIKRVVLGLGIVLAVLLGSVLLDQIPLSAARPPKTLKTLDDFRVWKGGKIKGKGTFQNSGVTYTVMLAPAGRYLASGPSAYLFDDQGRFVDWTADMGDFYTVTNRFDLTSGNVKIFMHAKP